MPDAADAQAAAYRSDSILIQLDPNATAAEHSRALEAIGGRLLDIIRGDSADGDLVSVGLGNGITVEKAVEILSHLPGVKFAEPDYILTGQAVSNDTNVLAGQTWGVYGDEGAQTNVYGSQATEAWAAGYTGSTKVAVGVVDTGADYTHPDLYLNIWLNQKEIPTAFRSALRDTDSDGLITFRDLNNSANASYVTDKNANGRIDAGDLLNDARWENGLDEDANGYKDDLIGWDFVNNDNDPIDDHGHGTQVSGIIGATGGNSVGVAGINWATQIVVLKFLNASNYGLTSNNIKATDYFTNASKAGTGVDFVATNQSWGGAPYSASQYDAIVRAAKADIFYVAAAGNGGTDKVGDNNDTSAFYPANYSTKSAAGYDAVISVAAITNTGALASFSNYGSTSVDLGAPGLGTWTTLRGGGYGSFSGTSAAAPHVTGALALYASAHPGASAAAMRTALLDSTTATTSLLNKVASDGRLDIDHFIMGGTASGTGVTIIGTTNGELISTTTTVSGQPRATAYADTLSGLGGNDTLDGGAGGDSMAGGAGNDVYVIDSAGDKVVELLGEGYDHVQSAVGFTLPSYVEKLTLTGTASTNATGNGLSNILTGNSGANFIYGAGGNDQLIGADGNDTLDGGSGVDTVNGGAGADRIDGGAAADLYIGGTGNDVFVMERNEVVGDSVQDFTLGDKIQFVGYSAGSTIVRVAGSTTDWTITDAATGQTAILKLLNSYALTAGDYLFG